MLRCDRYLYVCFLDISYKSIIIYTKSQQYIIPANISTSDQRWNNVDPTSKMKQNPTSDFQRCTTLIQRQCPTLKQRRNNVGTTLIQRCFNLALTSVKPILHPIGLVMIVDCLIVIHVKYMNSFYYAKWESIFLLYINNWTTNDIYKFSNSGTYRNTQCW